MVTQPKRPVTLTKEWLGQDAFILCGGTSVTDAMLDALKGHKVIAVNSMYTKAMWAPILFFADQRWWKRETAGNADRLAKFPGRIFTTSRAAQGDRLLRMRHIKPAPGIALAPNCLAMARTSLLAAMNMAVHLGARRVFLVGADNRDGDNGRAHCHEEYPWKRFPHTWRVKDKELTGAAPSFKAAGVPVFNCSPITTLKLWPFADLMTILEKRK